MQTLRNLQTNFAQAIFTEEAGEIAEHICTNNLAGTQRLQIYRNNVFICLTEALAAVYPVLKSLVGEEFFNHVAYQYVRQQPSSSGDLHDFGQTFADFITTIPTASHLPYLSEVAQMEWAYHWVFHAADCSPIDLTALATIPPSKYHAVVFKLHPASQLLAFHFPVLRIWQFCQTSPNDGETVNLDAGGCKVLVIRRQLEVELAPLSEGEFALLAALAKGQVFGEACDAALTAETNFDIAASLKYHITQGTLVKFAW